MYTDKRQLIMSHDRNLVCAMYDLLDRKIDVTEFYKSLREYFTSWVYSPHRMPVKHFDKEIEKAMACEKIRGDNLFSAQLQLCDSVYALFRRDLMADKYLIDAINAAMRVYNLSL